MKVVVVAVLAASLAAVASGAPGEPMRANRLTVSKPRPIVELSGDRIVGSPDRMAWSPDGRLIYLRTVERDIWANEKDHYYLLGIGDGRVLVTEAEPGWATKYWAWKSDYRCPGLPGFRIESETRTERRSATNAGAGGSIAQNTGDPYGPGSELGPQGAAIVAGALQSQTVTTTTLKLKGQRLGEFVNMTPRLGLTFGWAPEGAEAIAFANEKRTLVLMDARGGRQQLNGTKGALLPAWSDDGRRLAWLAQQGRGKYVLMVADVSG